MDDWEMRLPADVSLDDLSDDDRDLVAQTVYSQAIGLLRSPKTSRQLAEELELDHGSMEAVLESLRSAGIVDELPATTRAGRGSTRFHLSTPLIALHSRAHESCANVLANASAWLATVHSGEGRDRTRDVCVERLVRTVPQSLDLDILVTELRSVIASHASSAIGAGPAMSAQTPLPSEIELEVQIVVVTRDRRRHETTAGRGA